MLLPKIVEHPYKPGRYGPLLVGQKLDPDAYIATPPYKLGEGGMVTQPMDRQFPERFWSFQDALTETEFDVTRPFEWIYMEDEEAGERGLGVFYVPQEEIMRRFHPDRFVEETL